MKKILGLDLGTTSIGWALVNEAETSKEESSIIKLGVRVNPLTVDEKINFEAGRPLTTNADRTLKRGARRNLQRYKLRRENLIELLNKNNFIKTDTPLNETGKGTTHQTLKIRAKAAKEKVDLEELARILLSINKKRGYKSNRKAQGEDEGTAIDSMDVAMSLYNNNQTPGEYVYQLLKSNKKHIPDFYRSDLQEEFDKVWKFQQKFYPEILDNELYEALQNQGLQNSRKRFLAIKKVYTAENKGKRDAVKLQHYKWRDEGCSKQLKIEEVAYVLVEINNNLNKSSGYLGAISDRSKELYFNKETVGEFLWKKVNENQHTSLKNQVFYRQDYLDEFEKIWTTQAQFHKVLTSALKEEIRDVIIFYQRKLKSQKGQLSFCIFESWETEKKDKNGNILLHKITKEPKTRTIGRKVVSKSSPLFQEFKIWQQLNNLVIFNSANASEQLELEKEEKDLLFEELNCRGKLSESKLLKLLVQNPKEWKTNYPDGIEGNSTNQVVYTIFQKIAENEGYGFDWDKKKPTEIKEELKAVFSQLGIDTDILEFDANIEGKDFQKQASYRFWHLLYAAEEDDKTSEEDRLIYGSSSVNLKKKLEEKFGFNPQYAGLVSNIIFPQDYGNLSSRAIRKIIPFLQDGNNYSEACALANYNHSFSETKEEKESKILKNNLSLIEKNSLRNPVVEKILNQMVNVVNQVIETYGKPDEVRIELARELKKNAKQRSKMTTEIASATKRNDDIKQLISKDFGIPNPTKSDVTRYRLWKELEINGYKTLFTNKSIPKEKIFSKEVDIEHIIPKALLFDDSFSNKTLAYRDVNLKKSARTAFDFIESDYNSTLEEYKLRVEKFYNGGKGPISKSKRNKLLMSKLNLPDGFIERDLKNSQYIAKKSKEILGKVFRDVVSTSGSITDKLREDWDLINVMKELNLPKYKALGLIESQERFNKGTQKTIKVDVIKDWTKRNDHRHHAMDALAISFTTHNHIQHLNFLNARKNEAHKEHQRIKNIESKIMHTIEGKRKYVPPMPNFRKEAKKQIEDILISFKNKNKVVTRNINIHKTSKGLVQNPQLTPRGQLHNETVYGKSKRVKDKATKINKNFSLNEVIMMVNPAKKELVLAHLEKYENNPKLAFDTKTIKKDPLLFKNEALKEVFCFEEIYTIRKEVSPDNFKDAKSILKVVDLKTREILLNRLAEFNGKSKEAFSNLKNNPIWINKKKEICLKRVTITGVSNAEPLHDKKDHFGNDILDANGKLQAVDFVSPSNNHHVAIYKDETGKLQEKIVSFFEAVARVNADLPIIDKDLNASLGWQFQFTMKQNEMFVFPSENFDPKEIDLKAIDNLNLISKHLFFVQSISIVKYGNSTIRDFVFRNHLDSSKKEIKMLKEHSYFHIKSLEDIRLKNCVKVRINHIGQIVQVGEY